MKYLIAALLLIVACTPKQVIQQVPEKVIVKYLPGETTNVIDTTYTAVSFVHDTITDADTVIVTKTRWRETVREKRVIDTIPKYIVKKDTVSIEKKIPVPPWKWWIAGTFGFFFGGSMVFCFFRVFK